LNIFIKAKTTLLGNFFRGKYVFHLLFTLVYSGFVLLERAWLTKDGDWMEFMPIFFTQVALMVLVVYCNTLLLIPYLFEKKKYGLYVICAIALILLYTLLRSMYQKHIYVGLGYNELDGIGADYWMSFVYGAWFIVVSSMLFITQRWYTHRQQVKNIQISQLETELKYLRAQVNPHFMFNGLNTIYGYIDISNQQARNVLLQFADLLRYNLYEADVDWIDIEKEALYLQSYVALQRARSGSNMQIDLDISVEEKNIKVAPLIFIVFVENAFKFSSREDNKVNSIKIRLEQKGTQILFECTNPYDDTTGSAGGIGLNNVKRRLELLYKDKYTLTINKEQGIYHVQLILNL
jgi:two-component system, LytTR family, sensor kinase